ncbi:serine hydrolase [Chitinophaga sp. 212800010-3]|uniref:serine hydrolase n=1 Tax=unclassified Chitinophaga TaxID=2619133 RepID=UPI002DE9E425|nr:hypothetical protein [Chitinophaga sp. 212800010-3]
MKKILSVLLMTVTIQTVYSQKTTTEKMDELLRASTNAYRFNGSALVSKQGKILLEKGYGWKNIQDSLLNDNATIYQIASVTKQFTSAIIFKMIDLKKISLNDRISRFYPDFLKGDSISIENLLTHTSGINDQLCGSPTAPLQGERALLDSIQKSSLAFSPGTQFMYSNKGYQLLGYIIQRVSGMTYYETVRKYIFTPLNMTSSGFDFVHLANNNKATGYYYLSDTAKHPASIIDSSASFSAGSIYSTAGDLYKWLDGIGTYKIITKTSLEKACTPFVNPHYGYGWTIDTLFNKRVISHGGDIWGFNSLVASIPEDDIHIVLLENAEDIDDTHHILKKIVAILYNQPYHLPAKNEVRLSREILNKYIGSYEMQPGMAIKVELENGHLTATGGRKQELYSLKENVFNLDDGYNQTEIQFGVDESGIISDLSFYKNGKKIICKKIRQ